MIIVAINASTYAASLAALHLCAVRAKALGDSDSASRFAVALEEMERAYLRAIDRMTDSEVPALLKKQI